MPKIVQEVAQWLEERTDEDGNRYFNGHVHREDALRLIHVVKAMAGRIKAIEDASWEVAAYLNFKECPPDIRNKAGYLFAVLNGPIGIFDTPLPPIGEPIERSHLCIGDCEPLAAEDTSTEEEA